MSQKLQTTLDSFIDISASGKQDVVSEGNFSNQEGPSVVVDFPGFCEEEEKTDELIQIAKCIGRRADVVLFFLDEAAPVATYRALQTIYEIVPDQKAVFLVASKADQYQTPGAIKVRITELVQ